MENYRTNGTCSRPAAVPAKECMPKKMPEDRPDSIRLAQLPLAMGYVPMQRFEKTYDLRAGLQNGTIFPELNKPFCGKGGRGC